MILTEGEKMLVTPTCHVFDLYKVHQDADRVETFAQAAPVDNCKLPAVTHTASVKDGVLHVSAANISADKALPVELETWGFDAASVSGEILGNGDIHALNTFKKPNAVKPRKLDLVVKGGKVLFELPACSVATLTFNPAAAKKAPAKKAVKKASK
jgi:alpha-N-arabinofuranosidase